MEGRRILLIPTYAACQLATIEQRGLPPATGCMLQIYSSRRALQEPISMHACIHDKYN